MGGAVSTALASLRDRHVALASALEQARGRLEGVIVAGCGLDAGRQMGIVLDACSRTPELLACTTTSLVRATMAASELGLEFGSLLGECYIVPFDDRRKGVTIATALVGYRGFVKLFYGSPRVSSVEARLVREKDVWEVEYGSAPRLVHRPGAGDIRQRGDIVAAYARVAFRDGGENFDVMDRAELDAIRSKAKGPTWRSNPDEMYRKTPVRRLAKYMDLSALARRAVELDTAEDMRRGEFGALREGFESGRAEDLRRRLAERNAPVTVIEGEIET